MATNFMRKIAKEEHSLAIAQQKLQQEKAKHSTIEAEAEFVRANKEEENAKHEKVRIERQLREKELSLALQGVSAASTILANISTTSALMLGFAGEVLVQLNTSHIDLLFLKYLLWMVAIGTISMLMHAIFLSTLCVTNGIALTYYGNNGVQSVQRALKGMILTRGKVHTNFILGFVGFSIVTVLVIWVKLDQDAPETIVISDVWVGICCTLIWGFAVLRMFRSHQETTELFKILPKVDQAGKSAVSVLHPGYRQSRNPLNALRHDYATFSQTSVFSERSLNLFATSKAEGNPVPNEEATKLMPK